MNRDTFLNSLIGLPWRANAKGPDSFDCWHLCCHVERILFAHNLPAVAIPQSPSWAWMIGTFEDGLKNHPEGRNWRLTPRDAMGLITADDGAIVLMARHDRPAHSGIWLKPENRILHADPIAGVSFETLSSLRVGGWVKLRFYERHNGLAAA